MRLLTCLLMILTTIAPSLGKPLSRGPFGCGQGAQCPPPKWEKLEATNGAMYYVDVATITPSPPAFGINGNQVLVYLDDGRGPTIGNTDWFTFFCDRPLVLPPGATSQPEYVPPRSVFGRIREIACASKNAQSAPQTDLRDSEVDIGQALQDMKQMLKNPDKVKRLECLGIKIYENPQPPGHPPSPQECKALLDRNP